MLREIFDMLDVPYIILRDEELLPQKSGFDIDLLIDENNRLNIIEICQRCAENHGIIALHNDKRLAFFHLNYDNNSRNWAVLDLQSIYKFGVQRMNVHEMLDMPKGERVSLIKNVQDARKGRASKEIQENLGITPYAISKEQRLTFLQKIKRALLMRAFFIHMHTMPFIVVSGPDGVGKTTLITNIIRLFETLPFKIAHFHHTDLAKSKEKIVEVKEENMSIWRKLRRRYTPKLIKKIYGSIIGEIKYALRINREVLINFYSGTLTFSDRYIYDRTVKMHMLPDKLRVTKIATRINAYLMRKPTVLVIPVDTPEAIFKRKQELQPDEIIRYYAGLDNLFKNRAFPNIYRINVAGKTPEKLAVEATQEILQSLAPLVFHAIGMYEKDLKRS